MRRLLIPALMLAAYCGQASAADLAVTVRDGAGQPVRDAVVTINPRGQAAAGSQRLPGPYRMMQKDIAFDPFVLVVPVGADVTFPNFDKVRHHVYSFSPGMKFELKLYGREETRSYRFSKAGAAALGCNIHDRMIGFIKVVDTPYVAKTDASGQAVVRDAPEGVAAVRLWHPYLRAPRNEMVLPLTALAAGVNRQSVSVTLREPQGR